MIHVSLSEDALAAARAVDPAVVPAAVHAAVEIAVVEELSEVVHQSEASIRQRVDSIRQEIGEENAGDDEAPVG